MEIYNRRTPGSVTGIVFLLLGISGVLENISDMWVNFTLGKEIQKLDQTLARDSFLAGCFEGVFDSCVCGSCKNYQSNTFLAYKKNFRRQGYDFSGRTVP